MSLKQLVTISRLTISLVGVSGPTWPGLLFTLANVLCTAVRLMIYGILAKLRTTIWVGANRTLRSGVVSVLYVVNEWTRLVAMPVLLLACRRPLSSI